MVVLSLHCGAAHPRLPSGTGTGAGVPRGADGATGRVTSNILRGDYAGSESCSTCHAEVFAHWRDSPMHLMTRQPEGAAIRAPFNGAAFRFKDDRAQLTQKDGARFVRLTSTQFGNHLYRITRVIGGRYREDFAGVEIPDETAPAIDGAPELILPVSYIFETASFRLKGYSVLVGERPGLRAGGVWNQTCIFCHNTTPYFDSLWGELHGPGAPGYQGEVVDRLLPRERRWRFEVVGDGEPALAGAVAAEVAAVGGDPGGLPAGAGTAGCRC